MRPHHPIQPCHGTAHICSPATRTRGSEESVSPHPRKTSTSHKRKTATSRTLQGVHSVISSLNSSRVRISHGLCIHFSSATHEAASTWKLLEPGRLQTKLAQRGPSRPPQPARRCPRTGPGCDRSDGTAPSGTSTPSTAGRTSDRCMRGTARGVGGCFRRCNDVRNTRKTKAAARTQKDHISPPGAEQRQLQDHRLGDRWCSVLSSCPTVNTSRKATGGLPYHQTPFDPHIRAVNIQTSSSAMKYCN